MTQGFYEPLEGKDEKEKLQNKNKMFFKRKQLFSCCVLCYFLEQKYLKRAVFDFRGTIK